MVVQELVRQEDSTLAHFRVRTPKSIELTETRAEVLRATRRFLENENYLEVTTPTITGATGACENTNTIFRIDYFGHSAFLIQTSQLHLEAFVFGIPKVYSINHSYRAEPKIDDRRLCEFTLIEFEVKDMDLNELMDFEERYLRYVFNQVRDRICPENRKYIDQKFPRITYTEAINLLKAEGVDIEWGADLSAKDEKIITDRLGITFVTHYPESIKFFNMKYNRENPEVVDCVDLLLPGVGESIGGSVREYDHANLVNRLETSSMLRQLTEKGGKREDFDWYLELFEDVEVHRAGAGIGFERIIQFIRGTNSIKECVEFVRNASSVLP
ncbi:MAG: asparagine--tRNA ligase [bacterium]